MQTYLVFQVYAPLVSWGEQAVGQERATATHPSRSGLLGLLAAGLGLDRQNDSAHLALATQCKTAVKAIGDGIRLRDFHTAQAPASNKKNLHLHTRKDELAGAGVAASLSFRSYVQDAYYIVAIWCEAEADYSLETLKQALQKPKYSLYFGRKSCAPALPLNPCLLQADTLKAVLDQYPPDEVIGPGLKTARARYYWEYPINSGLPADMCVDRYDDLVSRARWQFRARTEFSASVSTESSSVSE